MFKRCEWADGKNELYQRYHDEEWGVPCYDDHKLFESLILEGAQAGLSWSIILNKRENYRKAFAHFEIEKVASFSDNTLEQLLQNPGIVRNKLKVKATRTNAQAALKVMQDYGSFSDYIWQFVAGQAIQNSWTTINEIPTSTIISDAMSIDLRKRGFTFVGSTICYAFMQAVGMVNDHTIDCSCYQKCKNIGTYVK